MESIKKAMLAMKNEKDAATDTADQLETTFLEAKEEQTKVSERRTSARQNLNSCYGHERLDNKG